LVTRGQRFEKFSDWSAEVSPARRLLTLVYYGLRDGEIGCLAEKAA
jgi:hypothetical protein